MKGKLILSGGGNLKESYKLDEKYFSYLPSHSKILYIPIALKRDRVGFEACYDWFSTIISAHSKEKDIDFSMILEDDDVPNLNIFDSIYLGGGNTFKLLDYVVTKKLSPKIIDFLNTGGIVYGGSAGAIIFGKDIRTVEEENDNNYTHTLGLNLLNNHSILCHYEESLEQKVTKDVLNLNHNIITIKEDSGIITSGDSTKAIGTVVIFSKDGIKKVFKNEPIILS